MKRYVIVGAVAGAILIGLVAVRRGDRAGAATRASADSGHVVELGGNDLARARASISSPGPGLGTLDPRLIRIASAHPRESSRRYS